MLRLTAARGYTNLYSQKVILGITEAFRKRELLSGPRRDHGLALYNAFCELWDSISEDLENIQLRFETLPNSHHLVSSCVPASPAAPAMKVKTKQKKNNKY